MNKYGTSASIWGGSVREVIFKKSLTSKESST